MARVLLKPLAYGVAYAYGMFTFFLYMGTAMVKGTFFRRPTEKEKLELLLAKDRLWNLSKRYVGLSHRFLTVSDQFKFHYLTNEPTATASNKPLVVFLHGFPDSWAIWRHVLSSSSIRDNSVVVAVDLPGYGGTDGLAKYEPTQVLEKITEFIIAIRERYGIDPADGGKRTRRVIVVGHDWGAVLGFRLAAEAPQLADRFIMTNGPLVALTIANMRLAVSSAFKMFKTFLRDPLHSHSILQKSMRTVKPVVRQMVLSGYIFVFQLPSFLVQTVGVGGNYSFLKAVHRMAAGTVGEYTIRDAKESMASTIGPGEPECKTVTDDKEGYPTSVVKRAPLGNFIDSTAYYRDETAIGTWHKSPETISALHELAPGEPRRTSTGTFDDLPGTLKGSATILWGKADSALDDHLALEGIADYLVHGSQVVTLPRSGHFTPIEVESRAAIEKAVEWAIAGERGDIGAAVASVYHGATVTLRK